MIPAVIRDLRERIPPLDVPPSEGFASRGTSHRCGTNLHIDFDHRRPRTTSPVRRKVEKRCSLRRDRLRYGATIASWVVSTVACAFAAGFHPRRHLFFRLATNCGNA